MDTKWQSSHTNGDIVLILIMGNRIFGNESARIREILLDLRFKVYHAMAKIVFNTIFLFWRINYVIYKKKS